MNHEFISLNRNDIPEVTTYELRDGKDVILVDDELIIKNPVFLQGFLTYQVSFKNQGEGLCYHGNTIIPTQSLETFLSRLRKYKQVVRKKRIFCSQINKLIQLCKDAQKNNECILHFGL